jgi:hypothetical protein
MKVMPTANDAPESERTPPPSEPTAPARPALTGLRLGLIAFGLVAVFALKELVFWDPPLTFTVGADAESGVLHDWESAPDEASLPLRFSDGTLVTLAPRARARVVAFGRAGAQIVLESGRARFDVQPARLRVPGESPWRVHVGPFSVEAESGRFELGWEPRAGAFGLGVFDGSVRVSGCDERHSLSVNAGRGLSASCGEQRWEMVGAEDALASVPSEPELAPSPAPPASAAPSPAPAVGAAVGSH